MTYIAKGWFESQMFFSVQIGLKAIKSACKLTPVGSAGFQKFQRSEHIHTGLIRMALLNDTSLSNLTPNCRHILNNAEQLAVAKKSPFVGTEHVLKSLLSTEDWILPWLINNPVQLDKDQVQMDVDDIILVTQSDGSPNFYLPCLERTLDIAGAIWSGHPLPTEGLVVGALLAHKEVKNAIGTILHNAASGQNILQPLLDHLSITKDRLESIPQNSFESYPFSWNPMVIAQCEKQDDIEKAAMAIPATLTPDPRNLEKPPVTETHWVLPGRLICGLSPGGMTSQELTDLVEAGVNTFVSLEKSYTERDCKDYRVMLEALASQSFPPHMVSFLHCPTKGVLPDRDLIAFITELKRSLEHGSTLYIHCAGGHGRTGVVVVNLLEAVCGIDMQTSMQLLSECHKMRGCDDCALNRGEMEKETQTQQLKRMEPIMFKRTKMIK